MEKISKMRNLIYKNNSFVLREVEGLNLLVASKKNRLNNWLISLNETAVIIWREANGNSRENLLMRLAQCFELDMKSAEMMKINDFIDKLISCEILISEEENNVE